MKAEYRIWWIPQVPGKAFLYPVSSIEEGKFLCNVLSSYDNFQFENNIKPDFCNVGGIAVKHPVHTENEWWEIAESEIEDFLILLGEDV